MQQVQVLNANATAIAIHGLGYVNAGATRTGAIEQTTFDASYNAYVLHSTRVGVLVRDPAASFTPAGYNVVTGAEALAAGDRFAAVTGGSAYALTLMAANAVPANTTVYFYYESGANTVTLTRAGSDTIDGGTTLALNGATPVRRLRSNGVSAWTSV